MTTRGATRLARWVAVALVAAGIAALLLSLSGRDPDAVTPHTLSPSLARVTGAPPGRCVHGRGAWMCAVPGAQATYLVTVVDGHCWTARLAGTAPGLPERASGCVQDEDAS